MDRWADHVRRARAGDRRAATELVEGNLGLVRRYAHRWSRFGVAREDLEAEGAIGLLQAIAEHDGTRAFTTLAGYRIRDRMFDFVRAERLGGMAGLGTIAGRIVVHASKIWAEAQGAPDVAAALVDGIAACTGLRPTASDALAAVRAAMRTSVELGDWLPAPNNPEAELERAELAHRVRAAVDRLPAAERSVVLRTVMGDELLVDAGGGGATTRERHAARIRAGRQRRRALERLRAELSEAA